MDKPGRKDGKRKISFLYRQKAKLKKKENSENTNTVNENDKESRIIVRNLPFKVTEKDVRKLFAPFGKIKEVNLLKRSDGNLVGCGFVQFDHVEDASKAIFNTNKKEFLGRIISSDWAVPKSKFCEKFEDSKKSAKDEGLSCQDAQNVDDESGNIQGRTIIREKNNLKMQRKKKFLKKKRQKKRARIVIRNLSFKITEDNLKEYFSQYGEIDEITLLRKPDGVQTGVAFLQFNYVQAAAKAIHYSNMQSLLDRPMIVDWAVPKNKFLQSNASDVKAEIKEKDEAHDTSEIQVLHDNENVEIESENLQTRESIIPKNSYPIQVKQETQDIESENDTNNDDDEDDDDDDDDVKVVTDEADLKKEIKEEENSDAKRSRRISNDVSEGRTIFLKQVPFSVKNEELKTYMEQFGPVYYALVCIDPLTEYSRGTAFVKFKYVEDAEKCLSAKELRLRDERMEAHRALHRNDVENKKKLKETRVRDSRNLYLVKEGVVVATSTAAMGVSVSDMEKRLKLEKWKSQMLRNLSMFVSKIRLVVYNLPPSFTDDHLRQLFKNYSDSNARITEARVMYDLKDLDATGKPKSKEYGFVTFTSHEDALKALRNINNNPNIFSKNRRPIVGFSIENRTILKAKEKRIQKSRENNPLWSGNKRKTEDTEKEVPAKRAKRRESKDSKEKPFAGITGKLGHDNLRSNFKLKSQAELHKRMSKKQKKLNKATKQLKIIKKEKIKKKQDNAVKQRKIDTEDANFNKLVDNHRNKVKRINPKKSKWYESSSKS